MGWFLPVCTGSLARTANVFSKEMATGQPTRSGRPGGHPQYVNRGAWRPGGNSASWGLQVLANGLPWRHGDEVLVLADEFPATVFPWLVTERHGVTVRQLELGGPVLAPERLDQPCPTAPSSTSTVRASIACATISAPAPTTSSAPATSSTSSPGPRRSSTSPGQIQYAAAILADATTTPRTGNRRV
jgi:hypothetical protein